MDEICKFNLLLNSLCILYIYLLQNLIVKWMGENQPIAYERDDL